MRGQYCDVMEPMVVILLGSCRPPPPGTCTGTDTPGEINPEKQQDIRNFKVYTTGKNCKEQPYFRNIILKKISHSAAMKQTRASILT